MSKTPFLTFVYLSRYNINLPCIFGNFEGRFFMNRSSPVTGGQGCKFPYITAFGSLLLPQLKKCKIQLQHIFLPMKAAARQELGVWGSIAKPFCMQRGLSKGDSEVRRGNEHPTVILIMENFNPFFLNTWNNFDTSLRQF